MKAIIYQTEDGGCAVIHPAPGVALEKVLAADVPPGVQRAIVNASDLPPDRYFRPAWKVRNGKVEIDVECAKECQRNVWRKLRTPKLAALDIEVMKAMETGNAARRKELSALKESLRDVTATPLPDDLEGIRNAMPDVLK